MASLAEIYRQNKTAYQQNLSKPAPQPEQPWTTRRVLGNIQKISAYDMPKAQQMYSDLMELQRDPTSKYYNAYIQPTNKAVQELAGYGVDTSKIDDQFFAANDYLLGYLNYNGTTNTPSAPTKKSTPAERMAYAYYQVKKSEEATRKVETQWDALQDELIYWANRNDRNYSDDEIINRIDWKKYGALTKLEDDQRLGQPTELNRGTTFSRDALYGILWAARNGKSSGSVYQDIANSASGESAWQYDQSIADRLNPKSEAFNPYSVGSTLDDAAMYFGVDAFEKDWLQKNNGMQWGNDETAKEMYQKVQKAETTTLNAERELAELNAWLDKRLVDAKDADKVLNRIDWSKYPTLAAMDKTMGNGNETGTGDLLAMTRKVDYKYSNIEQMVRERCAANAARKEGNDYAADTAQKANAGGIDMVSGAAPVYPDQNAAVIKEQDKALEDASSMFEEAGTPAEQTAAANSWTAAFSRIKDTVSGIADKAQAKYNALTEQAIRNSISQTSASILGDTEFIAGYEKNAARIDELDARRRELEEQYGADIKRSDKGEFNPRLLDEYGNLILEWQPGWSSLTEQEKWSIQTMLRTADNPDGSDVIDTISSVYNSYLKKHMEEDPAASEYNQVIADLDKAVADARANEERYNEAIENRNSAEETRTATIAMLEKAGYPPEKLKVFEETNAVIDALRGFTEYDPTQWEAFNPYDLYARQIAFDGSAEGYAHALAAAKEGDEKQAEELETAKWILDYSERYGIQVPDNIRNNLKRYIAKLERDHKDYEYFALIYNDDFKDGAAKGREIASAGIPFDFDAYERDGTLETQPLWGTLTDRQKEVLLRKEAEYKQGRLSALSAIQNGYEEFARGNSLNGKMVGLFYADSLMSDYEIDTYYYLLGTQGADAAKEYYEHLSDGSYGALTVRSADAIREGAADLADQGFWGRRAADVASMLMAPAAAIADFAYGLEYGAKKAKGEDVEFNPNNPWLSFNQFRTSARSEIQNEIKRVYGESTVAYSLASGFQEMISNRGDSIMNMLAFNWLSGGIANSMLQEFVGAAPMGISAAFDAMSAAKEKGASDEQAWLIGAVTFGCETLTEAISIGNISDVFKAGEDITADTIKSFLKNWVTKAGISEMVGESLNDYFENAADEAIMGPLSDHAQRVKDLKEANPNMSDDEAEAAARREELGSILHTAIISYLSPGLDIVSTAAGRLNYYRRQTKFYQKNGGKVNLLDVMRNDKAIQERVNAGAEALIEVPEQTTPEAAPAQQGETTEQTAPAEAPQAQTEAPAQEAGAAVSETEQAPAQTQEQRLAAEYELLDNAKETNQKSQTATIAGILDFERTDVSGDRADAAAAKAAEVIASLPGKVTNVIEWLKGLWLGASETGIDLNVIKTAVQNAFLGGENSAAYQEIKKGKFRKADFDRQAERLAATVEADAQNEAVQSTIENTVLEHRIAKAEGDIIATGAAANGPLKAAQTAQAAADKAAKTTVRVQNDLDARQKELEASANAVKSASANLRENPSDENKKQFISAVTKHNNNSAVVQEYQQALEKAKADQAAAEENAKTARDEALTAIRQQGEQAVVQEDQRRASVAEEQARLAQQEQEQRAEQERQINEQETNEEQEAQMDQEQYVRQYLEQYYSGDELEKQVSRVMGYAEQKSRRKENMNTRLSEEDGAKFMRRISRMTGMTYEMQDLGDPLKTRGKIIDRQHIILNSRLTKGQALVEAALHEVTHGLEDTKAYQNYASFVLNAMYGGENTKEYQTALKNKLNEYRDEFKGLTPEQARERARYELVAEYARLNLAKKEFVRGITSQGLAGKMRDLVSNALAMLKGYTLDAEGKKKYQELRTAMKLLNEAVNERAQHTRESNNGHTGLVQASITGWTNATGLTLEVTDDENHVYRLMNNGQEIKPGEYKADMVKGTPVGNLIDMAGRSRIDVLTDKLNRGRISQTEYNKQLKEIAQTGNQQREYVAQIINMIGQYQDAAMVWELAGSLAFSSLKTNGDPQYSDSYDFGTICTKTQAILNAISQTQVDLGRALTKEEIDGIVYEEVGKGVQDENGKWIHGATPCPPCYVYATWVNKPARLEKVRVYQNECANWTDEQINEFMSRPDPAGKTKTETNNLKTEQNSKKLWISLCLADEITDPKTGKKTWTRKENPDICPNEILLDLRRSGEMATQHPGTWTFMQKGGNAQGKAIAPYSDARLGESIVAKAIGANEANARMLEDERNAGNEEYIPQFLNPFLSSDDGSQEKAKKYFDKAVREIRKQNLKGGQRWQSWSDFRAEWGSDYLMEMITMQALGSQVQTYTKVVEALDLLASADFEVNMSLMPYGDGFWHNEDGSIKVDEDGNMMLRFSPVTGINPEAAEAYAKKYGEKGNVQPMVVGISDEHIKAALAGNYITFVIPFHGSGGSVKRLQNLMSLLHEQMDSGNDYTMAQSDKFAETKDGANVNANWAVREKILTGEYANATDEELDALEDNPYLKKLYEDRYINEDSDAFGVFFSKGEAQQIYPYEYWDTNSTLATADINSQRFIEYCQMLGVIPRFSGLTKTEGKGKNARTVEYANFSGRSVDENGNVTYNPVKGYWKLLIDRSMYHRVYDENGKIVPEKSKYHKPQAVSTADINIGAMPMAANNTVGHSDDETRQITERIIQRIEMTNGQNAAAGSAVDLQQNAETLNKAMYEGSDLQQSSSLGVLSDEEIDQILSKVESNNMTYEEKEQLAKERTAAYSSVFAKQYDAWDKKETGKYLDIGVTPQVLKENGVPDYKIIVPSDTILHFWNKHYEMIGDRIKEIPMIINHPILAVWSRDVGGRMVLFGEIGDKDGNPLMVVMEGQPTYDKFTSSSFLQITNAYIKDDHPSDYVNTRIKNGKLIYLDMRRVGELPGGLRLQLPSTPSSANSAGTTVPQNVDSVNTQQSKRGDLSDSEMDEILNGYMNRQSPQRQFGSQTAQRSDVLNDATLQYLREHSDYTPDTNAAELARAITWIGKNQSEADPDGYQESLRKVTAKHFNYRTKDGQARTLAVMGMAASKNDISAQIALADAYNREGTDIAQALQARKIFRLMTPEGRIAVMRKMLTDTQDQINREGTNIELAFSEWIYQAAANATDEGDFQKVQQAAAAELAQQIPANWKDKLRGWRMLSMLGNPRTHIRNLIGNALFVPAVSIKNKLGAIGEIVTGQKERTKTLAPVLPKEIRDFARQDAETIQDTLTGEAKYNEGNLVKREQKPFKGLLQAIIDFNGNALEKEDWIFLKGHYRRALGGWMQANGYTAEQLRNNPDLLEKGRAYAVQEAQKATYRDFNKLASTLNNVSRSGGVAGFLVDATLPFKKTPANILRRGIEYSPAGIMRSLTTDLYHLKQWSDFQNGKLNALPEKAISPNEFIDHLCAGLTGTAIMAVGALLSSAGVVSCGLDDDDDKLEKEKGNQKYSFKFSIAGQDFTYTVDWAAPMSMPFFVGSAIYEQLAKEDDVDVNELVNAFGNITEPVFNLSMLDGINTLFKTSQYDDTNTLTQIGAKIASNYVTSYVPSLLGAIARTVDDTQRKNFVKSGEGTGITGTFNYAREQVENKIPGVSQSNIPVRDIWGNAKTASLAERVIENFISPGYIENYKDDPLLNEIGRLADATQDYSIIPEDPPKSFNYKNEQYALDAEQWDVYKERRGQTAYSMLNDLLQNPDYQNASPRAQADMVKNVWSYADKVGRTAVIPDYDMVASSVDNIAKDSKVINMKDELIKALNAGNYDAYDTMIEALAEEGVEGSEIKTKVGNTYRDQYKDAYRRGDYETMAEIEDILDSSGYDFDLEAWEEQVDKKYGN